MARGGDRSAQTKAAGKRLGRPPKPKIEAPPADKQIATRVLGKIDEDFYWLFLLHWDEVKAAREKIRENPQDEAAVFAELRKNLASPERTFIMTNLERLTNRRDGTAPQRIDTAFNPETPLRVVIEHIGRPKDQAAAEAKSSGRSVE